MTKLVVDALNRFDSMRVRHSCGFVPTGFSAGRPRLQAVSAWVSSVRPGCLVAVLRSLRFELVLTIEAEFCTSTPLPPSTSIVVGQPSPSLRPQRRIPSSPNRSLLGRFAFGLPFESNRQISRLSFKLRLHYHPARPSTTPNSSRPVPPRQPIRSILDPDRAKLSSWHRIRSLRPFSGAQRSYSPSINLCQPWRRSPKSSRPSALGKRRSHRSSRSCYGSSIFAFYSERTGTSRRDCTCTRTLLKIPA